MATICANLQCAVSAKLVETKFNICSAKIFWSLTLFSWEAGYTILYTVLHKIVSLSCIKLHVH